LIDDDAVDSLQVWHHIFSFEHDPALSDPVIYGEANQQTRS
jgi:hypothetical protein